MFQKKFSNKSLKLAFSLIELSVVILVISILVVGATQGYNLVKSAQISNARGLTAKSPITQIQGVIAWYETSLKDSFDESQARDDANISSWKDISLNSILNGYNKLETATPSTNIKYVRSAINKIPAVKFTGSSKLSLTDFTQGPSSQATVFLVIKLNYTPDTTNFKTIFDGNSTDFSFSIKSDGVQINNGLITNSASVANSFSNSKEYAIAIYFNGSNSKVYVNKVDSMFGGVALNANGTNQLIGMTLGTNRSGTIGFNGYISEVAVFNRVIKTTERKEIFYYLSKKYNIDIEGI